MNRRGMPTRGWPLILGLLGFLFGGATAQAQYGGSPSYYSSAAAFRPLATAVITLTYPPSNHAKPAYPSEAPATVDLQVPADASVWFNGTRMGQTGSQRRYWTPPLAVGQMHAYDIEVRWRENGRSMSTTQRLEIRGGDQVSLELPAPNARTSHSSVIETPAPYQVKPTAVSFMSIVEVPRAVSSNNFQAAARFPVVQSPSVQASAQPSSAYVPTQGIVPTTYSSPSTYVAPWTSRTSSNNMSIVEIRGAR